jgi:hypothetical protein
LIKERKVRNKIVFMKARNVDSPGQLEDISSKPVKFEVPLAKLSRIKSQADTLVSTQRITLTKTVLP